MTTRDKRLPTYPGEGRTMVITGALIILMGAGIAGIGMVVGSISEPASFAMLAIAVLIVGLGIYRNYRGSMLQAMEDHFGPRIFPGEAK